MTGAALGPRDQGVSSPAGESAATTSHKPAGTGGRRARGQRAPRRLGQIPGGRHGLAPEAVAASQRARILAATVAAASERGYRETSVADVIARAGVSRKTFYEQFAGKDECFAEAFGEEWERLVEVTLSAFGDAGPWVVRLRGALTALCAALASNPRAARLCLVEALHAGPATAARRRAALRALAPLFEAAPAAPVRGPGLDESLRMGRIGDLVEILHHEVAAGAGATLPRLVGQLTYIMVVPFLGPERAARELGERDLREVV